MFHNTFYSKAIKLAFCSVFDSVVISVSFLHPLSKGDASLNLNGLGLIPPRYQLLELERELTNQKIQAVNL